MENFIPWSRFNFLSLGIILVRHSTTINKNGEIGSSCQRS